MDLVGCDEDWCVAAWTPHMENRTVHSVSSKSQLNHSVPWCYGISSRWMTSSSSAWFNRRVWNHPMLKLSELRPLMQEGPQASPHLLWDNGNCYVRWDQIWHQTYQTLGKNRLLSSLAGSRGSSIVSSLTPGKLKEYWFLPGLKHCCVLWGLGKTMPRNSEGCWEVVWRQDKYCLQDIFNHVSALAPLLQTYCTSDKQEFKLSGKDCVICEQILNINWVSLRNFRLNTCKR